MQRRTFIASVGAMSLVGVAGKACPQSPAKSIRRIRILAWNVACGQWCSSQQVAKTIAKHEPDIVLLNEAPKFSKGVIAADWVREVARRLGLDYQYVGSVSSGNHFAPEWGDLSGRYGGKFKAILSRWRLTNTHEYLLRGDGWSPASAVRAQVEIGSASWAIYSLHIPGGVLWPASVHRSLVEDVLAYEPLESVIVAGDFNADTDSVIMRKVVESSGLSNAITHQSIDHILYKSDHLIAVADQGIEVGPSMNTSTGRLSDHPYVWATLSLGDE